MEKTMSINVGDRMPEGSFGVMTSEGPATVSTEELFAGDKVVLFAVPGAFTPTCSMQHLPGYVQNAEAILGKGVDTIACMSVNDVFVMDAWGKDTGTGDKVMMLADGNGTYTQALGLELDASGFGMGTRSQRFAIVVDDGVVSQLHVEAPAEFKVSAAEAVLDNL
jgi:peroxiredoxin